MTNSFAVIVDEVNSAPAFDAMPANVILDELTLLNVANAASDGDSPANGLSYQLLSAPAGAAIDAAGQITWIPAESQGPSMSVITTVVTDDGVPALSATNSFHVIVDEVNTAPTFIGTPVDRVVSELTELIVTNAATDGDDPVNSLTYSLVNPPTGAVIDLAGVITWTPTAEQGQSTNVITTVVTDNGNPALRATNSFVVTVEVAAPRITSVTAADGFATITWTASEGRVYMVQYKDTLADPYWLDLPAAVTATGSVASKTVALGDGGTRFYRVEEIGTLDAEIGSVEIEGPTITITWDAVPGRVYQLQYKMSASDEDWTEVDPLVTATGATASATLPLGATPPELYRVQWVLEPRPRITSIQVSGGFATITWNASEGRMYMVQYKDTLADPHWLDLPAAVAATGSEASKTVALGDGGTRFYRVEEIGTLDAEIGSVEIEGPTITITWDAVPGRVYQVQYKMSASDEDWIEVHPLVTATGATASATLPLGATPPELYRVQWVLEPRPRITSIQVGGGFATITWNASEGRMYMVQYKYTLADPYWLDLPAAVTATGSVASKTVALGDGGTRFYRVEEIGTLDAEIGSVEIEGPTITITWDAVPGRVYRVQYKMSASDEDWTEVDPLVTATGATASATLPLGATPPELYRVQWVLEPAPVITSIQVSGGVATITWNASEGRMYMVQYKDALADPDWKYVGLPVTAAGMTASNSVPTDASAYRFYRVVAVTEPPVFVRLDFTLGTPEIAWNSVPGERYRIEYKSDMSAEAWSVLNSNVTAVGPTTSVNDPAVGVVHRMYRVVHLHD